MRGMLSVLILQNIIFLITAEIQCNFEPPRPISCPSGNDPQTMWTLEKAGTAEVAADADDNAEGHYMLWSSGDCNQQTSVLPGPGFQALQQQSCLEFHAFIINSTSAVFGLNVYDVYGLSNSKLLQLDSSPMSTWLPMILPLPPLVASISLVAACKQNSAPHGIAVDNIQITLGTCEQTTNHTGVDLDKPDIGLVEDGNVAVDGPSSWITTDASVDNAPTTTITRPMSEPDIGLVEDGNVAVDGPSSWITTDASVDNAPTTTTTRPMSDGLGAAAIATNREYPPKAVVAYSVSLTLTLVVLFACFWHISKDGRERCRKGQDTWEEDNDDIIWNDTFDAYRRQSRIPHKDRKASVGGSGKVTFQDSNFSLKVVDDHRGRVKRSGSVSSQGSARRNLSPNDRVHRKQSVGSVMSSDHDNLDFQRNMEYGIGYGNKYGGIIAEDKSPAPQKVPEQPHVLKKRVSISDSEAGTTMSKVDHGGFSANKQEHIKPTIQGKRYSLVQM